MLNDLLRTINQLGITEKIGKEKTTELAKRVIEIGESEDCNAYEILDGIAEDYGFCTECLEESEDLQEGKCEDCR